MRKRASRATVERTPEEAEMWRQKMKAVGAASLAKRRIFATPEEFTEAANAYFDKCDMLNELYGEAGLCLFLSERAGRAVTVDRLQEWYDGRECDDLTEPVKLAYMRIQQQIESDPRYAQKGMTSRAIFLQKQKRLGNYKDHSEVKEDATVRIIHGDSVDDSDFK